jgi:hypothetical protein
MRSAFVLILMSSTTFAAEPDAALRAKAALALAFAPPTYTEQYAKAVKENKPLVVFVGQPVRRVGNCLCVSCETFPEAKTTGVVIGLPDGAGLRRVDLAGEPTVDTIREAITAPQADRRSAKLPSRE